MLQLHTTGFLELDLNDLLSEIYGCLQSVVVWVAYRTIEGEKAAVSPKWVWPGWWFMEGLLLHSWLKWLRQGGERKRDWLCFSFKHLSCLLTALEFMLQEELFPHSWANRVHTHSLVKSKRHPCQSERVHGSDSWALPLACQVPPPAH